MFHRNSFKLASFPAASWRGLDTEPTAPVVRYPSAPRRQKRRRRKDEDELLFVMLR